MATAHKTVIVTGASQGIGAAIANQFLERGYNVVGNSRHISEKNELRRSDNLALVDGDIASPAVAEQITALALKRFGSIDALVNNAGIFISKPFIEYTVEDFQKLSATNLDGFFHITQRVIRHMLERQIRGSIVSITASIATHPLASLPASVAMITKGGINAISQSLALEYAKNGIRVNTVAPGVVETPLLTGIPKDFLRSLSPMAGIGTSQDIADAVLYLTEATQVTGENLRVNGGAHVGHW
jgi:NAD(P)-dependent dehydrogenase (short-subunit alcohol dehydrogenase family)